VAKSAIVIVILINQSRPVREGRTTSPLSHPILTHRASPLVALHENNGTVHGIDVELDSDPVFWFNNSLEAFIETFGLLDSVLRSPGALVPPGLRNEAELLDPVGFENSDWAGLLDALIK
jgi:hypothetical protein